jgi:hypothetical protein
MLTEGDRGLLFHILCIQLLSLVLSGLSINQGKVLAKQKSVACSKQHTSGLLLACSIVHCG